jgi:hypothetical protein
VFVSSFIISTLFKTRSANFPTRVLRATLVEVANNCSLRRFDVALVGQKRHIVGRVAIFSDDVVDVRKFEILFYCRQETMVLEPLKVIVAIKSGEVRV